MRRVCWERCRVGFGGDEEGTGGWDECRRDEREEDGTSRPSRDLVSAAGRPMVTGAAGWGSGGERWCTREENHKRGRHQGGWATRCMCFRYGGVRWWHTLCQPGTVGKAGARGWTSKVEAADKVGGLYNKHTGPSQAVC